MTTLTFDTLKFTDRLMEAGVPEAQARVQTEALADALSTSTAELATKGDLRELELRMKTEIQSLKTEMEIGKTDIIKWMVGLLLAQAALLATLITLFG